MASVGNALDQHHFRISELLAYRPGRCVFRRMVAVLRGLQRRKLDDHVARAAPAFGRFIGAAARQELAPYLSKASFAAAT